MASTGQILGGAGQGAAAGTAIAPGWGTVIGAGLGAGLGLLQDTNNADEALANLQKALAQYDAIGVPPDLARPIILQQLQQGGQLTPAYEQALAQENFAPSQIQEQPGARTDITATLSALKAMSQGGLNPEQKAAAQELFSKVNANTMAQMKGALTQQQMQGKSGAGDTLAAQLNAQQNGAQNLSSGAGNIAGQGFAAQSQALRDLLGGQSSLRSQDLSTLSQNAQLKQQAQMWQAQNAASRNARNTAMTNTTNQANWGRQNQVGDTNTMMANQELERQRQAEQQMWQDKLALAQGKASAYMGGSQAYGQMANNQNQNFNTMLGGLTSGAAAYGANQNNQKMLDAYNNRTNAMSGNNPPSPPSDNAYYDFSPNSTYMAAEGGTIPLVHPGSEYRYADGGMVQSPDQNPQQNMPATSGIPMYAAGGPINFVGGGNVPGVPMHPGNDYRNDVVPAMVSPGEIVVPNTHSHDPKAAAKFVQDEIDKK